MNPKQFYYILLFISISFVGFSQAPQWQWVKIGGTMGTPFNANLYEATREIITDSHGNVYGISNIGNFYFLLDTINYMNGPGSDDFCVFSYSCNGVFRWVRFFSSVHADIGGDISIDLYDNIYLTGMLPIGQYGD